MSVSVTSQQQLLQVARQAAHNDLNLAKSVCCAHSNVGKDGLVIIEEHRGTDDKVSVKAGLTFEAGWISSLRRRSIQANCGAGSIRCCSFISVR